MQVDLSPIKNHLKTAMSAIDRKAPICPSMDELYALLGAHDAHQTDQQVAELVESLPGNDQGWVHGGLRYPPLCTAASPPLVLGSFRYF